MKRYIITALCAFISYCAWGQLNAPCFMIDAPSNTPTLYNTEQLSITSDSTVIDLESTPIYALSVTGQVQLLSTANSMARIILVDNFGKEYLVYEINSLLTDTTTVNFERVGRETIWQDMIYASHLVVRLTNATVTMDIPALITEVQEQSAPAIKRARTMAQNDTIINVLNRNLIARDIPWRAGATNLSEASYDVRRSVLGDDNPFHNIEYFVGGYYVTPSFETTATPPVNDGYVKSFDWRNRHGKNWITSAKRQYASDCWAFAAIAMAESYINLYYNKNINIDLSEQQLEEIGSFTNYNYLSTAMNYVCTHNIVTEACCPYRYYNDSLGNRYSNVFEICESPDTTFRMDSNTEYTYNNITQIKQNLLKSTIGIRIGGSYRHVMECVGYKKIAVGDTIYIYTEQSQLRPDSTYKWTYEPYTVISDTSRYIGYTALALKNSNPWYTYIYHTPWYNVDGPGVRYLLVPDSLITTVYSYEGNVFSNQLTDSDIICSDTDNDGYYFWGIGDKPAHCPPWAPDEPDGDDSNPNLGPINQYGYSRLISPVYNNQIYIDNDTTFSIPTVIQNDLIIPSGITLTITSYLTMHPDAKIVIEGGKLILNGGTIRNGDINNKGTLIVKNNGTIEMCNEDRYIHNTKDMVYISNFKTPFNKVTQIESGGFMHVNR